MFSLQGGKTDVLSESDKTVMITGISDMTLYTGKKRSRDGYGLED
jgi:hypothetical protein